VSASRFAHWELAVAAEAVALGLWSREPHFLVAIAAVIASVVVAAAAARARRFGGLLTAAVAVGAAVAVFSNALQTRAVERRWPEVREGLIQQASPRLDRSLAEAVDVARGLAARGAELAGEPRAEAMRRLQALGDARGPERSVVVFDEAGRPWVWAGTNRLHLDPRPAELSAHITPFYVILEASRQVGDRVSVGRVLLAADSAVPDRSGTLAWQFASETGSALEFYYPGTGPLGSDVFDYCLPTCAAQAERPPPDTLFSVRAIPPSQGARKLEIMEHGGEWVGLLATLTLLLVTVFGSRPARWGGILGLAALLVLTPVGERIGLSPLFSPATYYLELLGPLSASAGALLLFAAVASIAFRQVGRRGIPASVLGLLAAGLVVAASPFLMWRLASGISPPATEIGLGTWLGWQLTLLTAGGALGLGAALLLGRRPSAPSWVSWVAGGWVGVLAVVGLVVWQPAGNWPLWYGLLWMPAVWLAVQPASRARQLMTIAVVVGAGAGLLTWGQVMHGRLLLAERDAERLEGGDPVAIGFLERFGAALLEQPPPKSAAELYSRWRHSPLSQDDYPGVLVVWSPDNRMLASLELAQLDLRLPLLAAVADVARDSGQAVVRALELEPGVHYVVAAPFPDGTVVTAGVAPRSQVIPPVAVGRFLRGERRLVAPYVMFLGEPVETMPEGTGLQWRRDRWVVRGSQSLMRPEGTRHLHAVVPLGDVSQLVVRGALLIILDAAFLLLLGLVGRAVGEEVRPPTWLPDLLQFRSYRVRLLIALAGFFVIPTVGYAAWSVSRLRVEAIRSRDLLIQQTLSDAAGTARAFTGLAPTDAGPRLDDLADRLGADLMWYADGKLTATSAGILEQLGVLGAYLPAEIFLALSEEDALEVTADASIAGQPTRVGYRSLGGLQGSGWVLAAPRLVEVTGIERERQDLAFGLLLTTLLGLGGAAALAALAARSLARPVQSLEAAALAVGKGSPVPPFDPGVPSEFVPVVDAFRRMARDVEASQFALEAARRRTATVLGNVATGVVALDGELRVTIANPSAQRLLGSALEPGIGVAPATAESWRQVWEWVGWFLRSGDEHAESEFAVETRRIRVQVAALTADPRGCVVALDDTTELAQAVRVLAWGEVARQGAHEIKNPLTPIRLGIQHLQRARRHGRSDFDATLERTAQQILAEIERLDAIARAFARFGAPLIETSPVVSADVAAIAQDAAALYGLGSTTDVRMLSDGPVMAPVRKDEVKEVLINLIENARNASAQRVEITVGREDDGVPFVRVRDDGDGISPDHLPLVFEPHFSTNTSGTGLGLAICRRLVESWGGTIAVESELGRGTTVTIRFQPG
jgi:signal transduction histidine kinase